MHIATTDRFLNKVVKTNAGQHFGGRHDISSKTVLPRFAPLLPLPPPWFATVPLFEI